MSRAKIKVSIDALKKIENRLTGAVDKETLGKIGERIREQMLDDISKGISPIKGHGRFPAYKWAGKANEIRKRAREIKDKTKRKQLRMEADKLISNKYPFTAEAKRHGKKPRPVNLELRGDFLKSLLVWFSGTGDKRNVHVGFKNNLSIMKEKGHREGANGQPKRPIIPQGRETLSPKYALIIREILAQNLRIKLR